MGLIFLVWCVGRDSMATYFRMFDINAWYNTKRACASYGDEDELSIYSCFCELEGTGFQSGCVLDMTVSRDIIIKFSGGGLILDQHCYPSSLAYYLHILTWRGMLAVTHHGMQHRDSTQLYEMCVRCGPTSSKGLSTASEQTEVLLTMALEHNMVGVVVAGAGNWADGKSSMVGCTLKFLLDWAWTDSQASSFAVQYREKHRQLAPMRVSYGQPGLWGDIGNERGDGPGSLTPTPTSLQVLLATFLVDCPISNKLRLAQGDFHDMAHLHPDIWSDLVERLIKFPSAFSQHSSIIKLTNTFYLPDHDGWDEVVAMIQDPLIQKDDLTTPLSDHTPPNMDVPQPRLVGIELNPGPQQCLICFDPLILPATFDCGHTVCWGCCVENLRENPVCPMCSKLPQFITAPFDSENEPPPDWSSLPARPIGTTSFENLMAVVNGSSNQTPPRATSPQRPSSPVVTPPPLVFPPTPPPRPQRQRRQNQNQMPGWLDGFEFPAQRGGINSVPGGDRGALAEREGSRSPAERGRVRGRGGRGRSSPSVERGRSIALRGRGRGRSRGSRGGRGRRRIFNVFAEEDSSDDDSGNLENIVSPENIQIERGRGRGRGSRRRGSILNIVPEDDSLDETGDSGNIASPENIQNEIIENNVRDNIQNREQNDPTQSENISNNTREQINDNNHADDETASQANERFNVCAKIPHADITYEEAIIETVRRWLLERPSQTSVNLKPVRIVHLIRANYPYSFPVNPTNEARQNSRYGDAVKSNIKRITKNRKQRKAYLRSASGIAVPRKTELEAFVDDIINMDNDRTVARETASGVSGVRVAASNMSLSREERALNSSTARDRLSQSAYLRNQAMTTSAPRPRNNQAGTLESVASSFLSQMPQVTEARFDIENRRDERRHDREMEKIQEKRKLEEERCLFQDKMMRSEQRSLLMMERLVTRMDPATSTVRSKILVKVEQENPTESQDVFTPVYKENLAAMKEELSRLCQISLNLIDGILLINRTDNGSQERILLTDISLLEDNCKYFASSVSRSYDVNHVYLKLRKK